MSGNFKPSDIVEMRSGGPRMTVTKFGDDGMGAIRVWCEWFHQGEQKSGQFSPSALQLVDDSPKTLKRPGAKDGWMG